MGTYILRVFYYARASRNVENLASGSCSEDRMRQPFSGSAPPEPELASVSSVAKSWLPRIRTAYRGSNGARYPRGMKSLPWLERVHCKW